MKKITIIVAVLIFLSGGFGDLYAKPFKPLGLEGVVAEIPDDVVLPDTKPLEFSSFKHDFIGFSGEIIEVQEYRHPEFVFRSWDGSEIYPYTEIFRYSQGGEVNLVGLVFINSQGQVEIYADGDGPTTQPSGKLERKNPSGVDLFRKIFKAIPRERATPLVPLKIPRGTDI